VQLRGIATKGQHKMDDKLRNANDQLDLARVAAKRARDRAKRLKKAIEDGRGVAPEVAEKECAMIAHAWYQAASTARYAHDLALRAAEKAVRERDAWADRKVGAR
jgi:DNA-directed RNA polymerase subunit K/omega